MRISKFRLWFLLGSLCACGGATKPRQGDDLATNHSTGGTGSGALGVSTSSNAPSGGSSGTSRTSGSGGSSTAVQPTQGGTASTSVSIAATTARGGASMTHGTTTSGSSPASTSEGVTGEPPYEVSPITDVPAVRSSVYGLASGASCYVAVGADTVAIGSEIDDSELSAVVYRSSDAVTWERLELQKSEVLTDVAFGNGTYVAIGHPRAKSTPRTIAYASQDGRSWQRVVAAEEASDEHFAFGNGYFLFTSSNNPRSLYRSSDGTSWETLSSNVTLPDSSRGGVEFAAGVFALYGQDDLVAVSGTGSDWALVDATGEGTTGVARHWIDRLRAVNDQFRGDTSFQCCFGETGGPWSAAIASSDGRSWTQGAECEGRAAACSGIGVAVETPNVCIVLSPSGALASGPNCTSTSTRFDARFNAQVALSAGGRFLVGGELGLLTSAQGLDWTWAIGPGPSP